MAIFALWIKMKQLEFMFVGDMRSDWTFMEFVSIFAFLNQVAGLRLLRKVETETIQHFVFSGADASLDTEELLLLDDWWNITLISAVSNLQLNLFDNMVFWFSLDPQKTQLLLKNHVEPRDESDGGRRSSYNVRQIAKESDKILNDYDAKVFRMLDAYEGKGGSERVYVADI